MLERESALLLFLFLKEMAMEKKNIFIVLMIFVSFGMGIWQMQNVF